MWTYLLMMFSVGILMGIFIRRWLLHGKKKEAIKKPAASLEEVADEKVEEKVSRSDKVLARTLCEKAEKKLKAGKEEDAIKLLVQALAANPGYLDGQHMLAMLYLKKQMYGAAAALFKQLTAVSEEAVHFSHLGLCLYNQQELQDAKQAYQKAVDLDPSRPQRFISLGQVYRGLGEYSQAIIAVNKAVDMEKENAEFLLLLGDILNDMGDADAAALTFKKVLEIDPKNNFAKEYLKNT